MSRYHINLNFSKYKPKANNTMCFLFVLGTLFSSNAIAQITNIIAIGPSVNTIIKKLQLSNGQVVAIDNQSTYLYPNSDKIKNLGYLRTLSLEGLLALKANICINTADAGPQKVLSRLPEFGIKQVNLKPIVESSSVYENILLVGNALNAKAQAQKLKLQVQQQSDRALHKIPQHKKLNGIVLLQVNSNGLMMLGKNTRADFWLKLMQINNLADFTSARPISKEGLLALKPDIVIIAKSSPELGDLYQDELTFLANKNHSKIIPIATQQLEGVGANFGETTALWVHQIYD